jgi:hypothetical protein
VAWPPAAALASFSTQRERDPYFYRRVGLELIRHATPGVQRDSAGHSQWFTRFGRW